MKQIRILFYLTFVCIVCVSCYPHSKFILYNLSEEEVRIVYEEQGSCNLIYRDSLHYEKDKKPVEITLPSGQGFVLGKGVGGGVPYINIDFHSLQAFKDDSAVFSLPVGLKTLTIINVTFEHYSLNDWNKLKERGYKFELLNEKKEYKENPKRKMQRYEFYPVIFIE